MYMQVEPFLKCKVKLSQQILNHTFSTDVRNWPYWCAILVCQDNEEVEISEQLTNPCGSWSNFLCKQSFASINLHRDWPRE